MTAPDEECPGCVDERNGARFPRCHVIVGCTQYDELDEFMDYDERVVT